MLKITKLQIFQWLWGPVLFKFHDIHEHYTNITNVILYTNYI